MKAEQYNLISDAVKANIISRLIELPSDGKVKVVISNAGDKSARQRGLQWKWYTETALAGIGGRHEDTKNGVHLVSKWRWALPILIRDDEFFAEIYLAWHEKYADDEERMLWFVDTQVHTERMSTSQMAEFLTDYERHYGARVNLTDPRDFGLNLKRHG